MHRKCTEEGFTLFIRFTYKIARDLLFLEKLFIRFTFSKELFSKRHARTHKIFLLRFFLLPFFLSFTKNSIFDFQSESPPLRFLFFKVARQQMDNPHAQILDFSQDLSVPLFDATVLAFYRSVGQQVRHLSLTHSNSRQRLYWNSSKNIQMLGNVQTLSSKSLLSRKQRYSQTNAQVHSLLRPRFSKEPSRRCGRLCLWNSVKVRSHAHDVGIKNFIVAVIIKTSSDQVSLEKNRTLLGKLNIVLVQVRFLQLTPRSSNKTGLTTGPHLSPKSCLPQNPISRSAKITWSFSSS